MVVYPSIYLTGALKEDSSTKPPTVPAVYIVKYNRFVDNILEKMNDILKTSYDPVSVKLQPIDVNKKSSKPKKNKNKPKRKTANKKKTSARGTTVVNKNKENPITEIPESVKEHNTQSNEVKPNDMVVEKTPVADPVESRAVKDKTGTDKAKPTKVKTKPPTKVTKPKPTKTKTTTKKPPTNKNKTKTPEKSKPRAKGTLYGLSSLRRTGDVAVNIMSDHTTVKSNFAVGPLILRVQKEVEHGAKKDIRSATATTAEMLGKLTLRVNNKGVASLHNIKVLQPKQVRVDSNNESTRELVWQRSARIAHMVSQKLLSASRPMFKKQTITSP